MGICNSRPSDSKPSDSKSIHDKQAEQQSVQAAGDADNHIGSAQAAQVVEPETAQPHTEVAEGDHPGLNQVHKYNSMDKPFRSAMRPSMDAKSDTYSRRSTGTTSGVGFQVDVNAPDAEPEGMSLMSVSTPGPKSPSSPGRRAVAVTTPTSPAAAPASASASDDGAFTEQHRSFAGADSISLKKILDIFYDKVLEDAQLGPYFKSVDMIKLKRHQLRFMSLAFGGKELVFEEDPTLNLRKIHYHLIRDKGLSLAHWELFVNHFDETMEQLEKDLPLETRQAASRSIRGTKHYFVPIGEETEYTNASISSLPDPEPIAEAAVEEAEAAAAEARA